MRKKALAKNKKLLPGKKTWLQIGALPLRRREDGTLEVLLITTRTTGRWSVPKGWPIKGLKSHEAAAREAFEEAGVTGKPRQKPLGRYLYWKRMADHFALCKVKLFPLWVETELDDWPERGQRQQGWFSLADAAELVDEPGLRGLLGELELG